MTRLTTAALMWLLLMPVLDAQQPPAPTAPAAKAAEYDDGGRRDPFVSLIVPKAPATPRAASPARPAAGLAGLSIADVQVKGLIKSGTSLIALLAGPDGRTYMAKRADRLADGVVTRIENDSVVFTERTPDAAGVMRARDVRKPLRATVSGGQQ